MGQCQRKDRLDMRGGHGIRAVECGLCATGADDRKILAHRIESTRRAICQGESMYSGASDAGNQDPLIRCRHQRLLPGQEDFARTA